MENEIQQLIAVLEQAEARHRSILDGVATALGALRGAPAAAADPATRPKRAKRAKPQRVAAAARTPKRSKTQRAAAKKPADTPKGLAPHEPRKAKGRMPTVGVETFVAETPAACKAKVDALRGDGYRRVGAGQPLAAGCYDVRADADGPVVIWRPKAA